MLLREACGQQTGWGLHETCQQTVPVLTMFALLVQAQTWFLCCENRLNAALGPGCMSLLCSENISVTQWH